MAITPVPSVRSESNEIDLAQLGASLKRHYRLILKVTSGTLLLTLIVTLLQKRTWEGDFQIVLASPDASSGGKLAQLAAANPMLAGLAGLGGAGGKDSLETEVQILQSSSVLKPVFDYVRRSKRQAGQDVDDFRYEEWLKETLVIKLEKGTSVLNIRYRDSDRELILPVIDRISKAYQEYSGRDRRRNISNAVSYLQGRIALLTPKADASMRQAQSFALAHGLGLQDGLSVTATDAGSTASSSAPVPSPGRSGGSVEAARLAAQSQLNDLRQQLANAQAAGGNVLFQAPQLRANEDLYKQYQFLEAQIAEKRSRLRENDEIIRALNRQRTALIATLNRQTIGLLQGQLATAQANLQANTRPKEVVLAHRQLVRQALRDERTLAELENQLQLASLEQAKQSVPWDLISAPTLSDRPVAPRMGTNLAVGLLAGLVLGSGAALLLDRRRGQLFSLDELKTALPYPLLAELDPSDPQALSSILSLLVQGSLDAPPSLALIPVGLPQPSVSAIAEALRAALHQGNPLSDVVCSPDLLITRTCSTQLLLMASGAATRNELAALLQQLQLQGSPVAGWLWLRPGSDG
jgi:uncharacterized protein involved in exopolysaccharide biosynthesis